MHCYFCDQTSPEGSLFCKPCGSPFHLAPCPICAAVNALAEAKCYKCSATLDIKTRSENSAHVANKKTDDDLASALVLSPVVQRTTIPVLVNSSSSPLPKTAANAALAEVGNSAYLDTVPFSAGVVSSVAPDVALAQRPVEETAPLSTLPVRASDEVVPADSPFKVATEVPLMPLNAIRTVDLMQRAQWGQRALIASFALLVLIVFAYFFLRSPSLVVLENTPILIAPSGTPTSPTSLTPSLPASPAVPREPSSANSTIAPAEMPIKAPSSVPSALASPPPGAAVKSAATPKSTSPASTLAITTTPATTTAPKPVPVKQVAAPPRVDPDAAATAAAIAAALGSAAKVSPDAISPAQLPSPLAPESCPKAVAALGLCGLPLQPAQPPPPKPN